jgi:hypothetical protein
MSAIDTIPPTAEQATTETLPWGFDFTNLLLSGETLSAPTVTFTTANGASAGTLTPSLSGKVVTIPIAGSLLTAGMQYDVSVSAQAAAGKVWTMRLTLSCPA